MDDDQIFHSRAKKRECLFYGFSASIHKGHRFGEDDLLRIDPSCSVEGFETSMRDEDVVYFGKSIRHQKSDIVSVPPVVDSRIPQSYDDLHTRP